METQTVDALTVPAALRPFAERAWEVDALYRYMVSHGITQSHLARQLGVTRFYIRNVFLGHRAPPEGFIERAAEALEIPVVWIRRKVS